MASVTRFSFLGLWKQTTRSFPGIFSTNNWSIPGVIAMPVACNINNPVNQITLQRWRPVLYSQSRPFTSQYIAATPFQGRIKTAWEGEREGEGGVKFCGWPSIVIYFNFSVTCMITRILWPSGVVLNILTAQGHVLPLNDTLGAWCIILLL